MKFWAVLQLKIIKVFKAHVISLVTLDSKARTSRFDSAIVYDILTGSVSENFEFWLTLAAAAN